MRSFNAWRALLESTDAASDDGGDVQISELGYREGTLYLRAHHPGIVHIAEEVVRYFKESGGINYVSMALQDPKSDDRYEMTVQRLGGRLPAEENQELRELVREIYEWTDHKETPWALRAKKLIGDA